MASVAEAYERFVRKRDLIVRGEENEIRLGNVLVGEVWLCGGQSNMEYPMDRTLKRYAAPARGEDLAEKEWKNPNAEGLRLFWVEKKYGLPDCQTKGWLEAESAAIAPFSAAAYFSERRCKRLCKYPSGSLLLLGEEVGLRTGYRKTSISKHLSMPRNRCSIRQ